jgi:hypothetical protein
MARKKSGKSNMKRRVESNLYSDSDETYAFIAGYTAWGFAYGTTWEEMEWFANMDSLYATIPPEQGSILLDDIEELVDVKFYIQEE